MSKPVIFISHIHEEASIAIKLKELIEAAFECDVFVASAPGDLPLGRRWLDQISDALRRCVLEIVIVSPISASRRWINFEAGAGWVRDIPVVPLCHSGMQPGNLPAPLNALQMGLATDLSVLESLWRQIGQCLSQKTHPQDFDGFIATVKDVESRISWTVTIPPESPITALPALTDFEKQVLARIACVLSPDEGIGIQQLSNRLPNIASSEGRRNLALRKFDKLGLVTTFEAVDNFDSYRAVNLSVETATETIQRTKAARESAKADARLEKLERLNEVIGQQPDGESKSKLRALARVSTDEFNDLIEDLIRRNAVEGCLIKKTGRDYPGFRRKPLVAASRTTDSEAMSDEVGRCWKTQHHPTSG